MGNTSGVLKETGIADPSIIWFHPNCFGCGPCCPSYWFSVRSFSKYLFFALFVFVQSLDCHIPSVFSKYVFLTLFRDTLWNVSSEMNTSMPSIKLQLLIIEAN